MGVLEAVRGRKKVILAFEAAGFAFGLYLLYFIVTRPVTAEVVGRHIVYESPHFYLISVMVLYLAATCVSCFFSSHRYAKLLACWRCCPSSQRTWFTSWPWSRFGASSPPS
jgi:hypothetical protein